MPYVVAALIILAVVCLLNLLLTYGIIRRLRAQSGGHDPADDLMLPANAVVPEFTAHTTTGDTVSRSTVSGGVIAFFSPGCGACEVQLPRFVDLARTLAGDEDRPVLAVLHGDEEETREHLAALTQVTDVVVEQSDGPIGTAFDVSGYPTFALIDADGKITASSFAVNRLPLPVATASAAHAE